MSRSSSYSQEEDKLLCQLYMDISQDPIKGVYQSSKVFWARVKEAYENEKNATWSERTQKSIQCRIQAIEKATKKFHACIRQCENRHQSGASNDDILNQAKSMLSEDPSFPGGWKFDHIWSIIKNFEKFKDGVTPSKRISIQCDFGYTSLESENPTLDSPTQTFPGLSSFSLNDDDEIISGSPSPRPNGVKKSKMKRKLVDQTTSVINTLEEGNKQLLEQLKKTSAQREDHLEIQKKNYALNELKEENKILFCDLNSFQNPNVRAYFESEQARILQKRRVQQQDQDQETPPPSTSFGQYFNYLGGSTSNLPDY